MEKEPQRETGMPVDMSIPIDNTGAKDISISSEENGSPHDSTTDVAPPIPAAEGTSPKSSDTDLQTIVIMFSLCAALFLAALDITIVTTALPTITHYFQSDSGYTWIGSAYLLTAAAFTPSWGKLSDIWGRKPILLLAVGVFFIGSTLAATSVSIAMLIAARAIQGIGGGGLVVLVNICVSDLFSMRNRGKYLGMIAIVWAVASATGPILGGVFAEKVSWRWCFYINLPITGTVFILLWILLKLDNPKTPVWDGLKAVDWMGSITIVGGTLMLLLGLDFGGVSYPWSSATVICLIIFGVLTIALFIVNEWRFARYPVIPLRIFKHSSNIAAIGVCFCHGFVFIAGSYYLPLYFQSVIGAGPLLSGAYLLPYIVSFSFVSYATGILIKQSGKYLPTVWLGLAIMTLGFGLFIDLPLSATWSKIILYQIVAGIGVGQNFNSPLVALQTLVKPGDIATATATFFFTRILSTSVSVVIGSVVFQNEMQKQQPSLIAALGAETANVLSGGSAAASVDIVAQLPDGQREVARAAFHHSLKIMWIMYMAFAALGLGIGFFIGNQILSQDHTVTKTGLKEEEGKRQEELEKKREDDNIEAGEADRS